MIPTLRPICGWHCAKLTRGSVVAGRIGVEDERVPEFVRGARIAARHELMRCSHPKTAELGSAGGALESR